MPLRHASMHHQLQRNGMRLHAAMMSRIQSHGADDPPSEEELELMEERRQLKAARDERHAQEQQVKAKAPKTVRTTRAQPKPKEACACSDEALMARLYVIAAKDQKAQRVLNRLWTRVKTGN